MEAPAICAPRTEYLWFDIWQDPRIPDLSDPRTDPDDAPKTPVSLVFVRFIRTKLWENKPDLVVNSETIGDIRQWILNEPVILYDALKALKLVVTITRQLIRLVVSTTEPEELTLVIKQVAETIEAYLREHPGMPVTKSLCLVG